MFDFTNLTNMFKGTLESAANKTGEVVEVSKMKLQIAQQRAELSKAYEKLGAMVYDMMKSDSQDSSAIDVCIDEIDFIFSKIAEAESKVNELRKVSICEACGAEVALDACFCSKCGAKIERPEPAAEEEVVVEVEADDDDSIVEEIIEEAEEVVEEVCETVEEIVEEVSECCEEKKEEPEA
jgi:ribosomal protein L40E